MQTLVSIKNEDRAGWQPLPLYSHLSLTLEMFFGKCDSPSLEGCPVRLPAQVLGHRHRAHQIPKILKCFSKLRKKPHNEQEKCRAQNVSWSLESSKWIGPTACHRNLQFSSVLLFHKKGWRIQAKESSQWDSHSLKCKGTLFSAEYRRDGPSLEQAEGFINTYHPLSDIH